MITIKGRIPSKKNGTVSICRNNRVLHFPSNRHRDWHKDAMIQLEEFKPTLLNGNTIHLHQTGFLRIIFYAADARLFDLTNKAESIMDILVDAGFLLDDSVAIVPKLQLEFGGIDRENPRAEIYDS